MPTRSARRSASPAIVEALGGTADPVCTDASPPLYAFLAGIERFRTDPDPDADYDLLVISDCGTLDRVGRVRRPARGAVRAAAAGRHRPPRVERREPAPPTGSIRRPPRPARWSTLLAARLGVPLDADDGSLAAALMAGIVMDTATFAHPNATPRTLAVSAALVEAGAPLSDISRRLYRSKPEAQLRLFGRVLDRLATS